MLTGPSTEVVPVKTLSDNVSSSFTTSNSFSSVKSSLTGLTVISNTEILVLTPSVTV